MHLFGKARKQTAAAAAAEPPATPGNDDAMAQIKMSKEMIEKRMDYLTRKIEIETQNAIGHKNAGRKPQALACLKVKKQMEDEISGLMQRVVKVNAMDHSLSQLKFTEATLAAEQAAAAEIKRMLKRMGDLDEHRAETDEALESAYEALGIVSEPSSIPGVSDDDDEALLEELEAIEKSRNESEAEQERKLVQQLAALEMPGGTSGSSSAAVSYPTVPLEGARATRQREQQEERELEELERLQASMKVDQAGGTMAMLGAAAAVGYADATPSCMLVVPSAA